ncbi:hypothetical protein ACRE_023390 [Hapsidospora chrysogenum ATCC 11550]|uniref:Uncharacterized protein n=1 Tax=Hapsidospora chrysogenum (strain ATCC 11550 / CBS 779.69 / DSM 880 / IAM 14645 / JCM 23072 / IMI 49137) TaxID=857340 RepID=A0A086TBW6_HAPC1|nr:hypothetical protein ACRE_023390 [Hapsidospora chrysogenum ATCC 11550]
MDGRVPRSTGRVPASSVQLFRNDDHDYLRHKFIDFREDLSYPPTFNGSEEGASSVQLGETERDTAAVSETLSLSLAVGRGLIACLERLVVH